jgi:cytochrome P450
MTTISPPGPKPSPFWGNLREYQKDSLGALTEWAHTYGDVVKLRFGPLDMFLLNDPDDIQQVLVKDADKFHKSPIYKNILSRFLGNGLVTSDGDFWKRQRRLVQPAFHATRIHSYADTMVDFTLRMLAEWDDGQIRDIDNDMTKLTLNIAAKTLFDSDASGDADAFGDALTVLMNVIMAEIRSPIRFPDWLPTTHNRQRQRAIDTLDAIVLRMIEERRRSGEDHGDLLSMLLLAQDEGAGMTDKQVLNEALTLFLAGHETTANLMTWTWYMLSEHPQIETRLHDELDRVLQGHPAALVDLPNLPYAEMVLKESMRLYPPAWIFSRIAVEDVQLKNYLMPTGTMAFIVPFVTQRDGRFFLDPMRFMPERFSAENEPMISKYAYIPFGGGARICVGNSFAMMEAHLLLATIASQYRLKLVDGHPIGLEPLITLRPAFGMRMHVSRRHTVPIGQQHDLLGVGQQ